MSIYRTHLSNGMTIVHQYITYAESVSAGIWVKAGSRYEEPDSAGISHFMEHMNFKGTAKRSAAEISEVLEHRGGQLNAYTGKEYTHYYAISVKEDTELIIDVLSDIVFCSLYRDDDIEKEKNVVIEEINLYEDSPDDLAVDLLHETIWPEHPLGRPTLGYESTVRSFDRQKLTDFHKQMYTPDNMVFGIVGNISPEVVSGLAEKYFGNFSGNVNCPEFSFPDFHFTSIRRNKPITQEHLCIGFPCCSMFDNQYYNAVILNEYLGGGSSSVLFQKIREGEALSYNIYSYLMPYEDTGLLMVYGGTAMGQGEMLYESCRKEIESIAKDGIPKDKLELLKQQIEGGMRIAQDSLASRLSNLGRNELYFHRDIPISEIASDIRKITRTSMADIAQEILDYQKASFAWVGGCQ